MHLFLEKVLEVWKGWEIRSLVLLSVSFQILLVLFGSQRKYTTRSWIRFVVWLAYLAADLVPTIALGNLATNRGGSEGNSSKANKKLQAFWASFLLLHLAGPDTITAYALEDNELWLRHLLGLVVQVTAAFYVFSISRSNSVLTFLAILIFVVAIIKYGERTFVLWSTSSQSFKDSMQSNRDPISNLVKVNEQDREKILQKLDVNAKEKDPYKLAEAFLLFKTFATLFADLVLEYSEVAENYKIFGNKSAKEAFDLVSMELGFMYDILYTKATIVYSQFGIFVRCLSFCSTVSVLVVFSVAIDIHAYSLVDISITYLLLVGAVVLEIYSFMQHIFSDWTKLFCLIKLENTKPMSPCQSLFANDKRWSASMGQFSLISFCIKDMPTKLCKCIGLQKLLRVTKFVEKYQYLTSVEVDADLQELIYNQIRGTHEAYRSGNSSYYYLDQDEAGKIILDRKGEYVLGEKYSLNLSRNDWCISEREFEESLISWHIATDICYYQDLAGAPEDAVNHHPKCKASRVLSNYMLYLLIFRPSMLPRGKGELRYKDTCDEAMLIFDSKKNEISKKKSEACKLLFETMTFPSASGEIKSISVLDEACALARDLQLLASENNWDNDKKWEMISDVWVEMLTYVANHCGWKEHGQQLRGGGELLTHVCLLMAHFGLSAQYVLKGRKIPP